MSKSLIIVESPAKARTISKILGTDYVVKASVGHILDLPQDRLGVDINHDFRPQYQRIKGKSKVISELKKAADDTDFIYLATDPDREGEAIAFHIAEVIAQDHKPVRRVLFHEITKSAVQKAMAEPGEIDRNKVDAQQARRVLDRLVGYQVSPVLWKTVAKGLSAGRVQSVALRLLCEREDEIRIFRPEEYWSIEAELKTPGGEEFKAELALHKNKKIKIPDKKSVDSHLSVLQSERYYLKDRQQKKVKRTPQPPFTTSTLQQEAARRFRFSGKKTMMIAQALYEGIELGAQGQTGLITYMRTDSVRVAPEAIASVREHILNKYSEDYLPSKARFYKSQGRTQEAHEAIRPTNIAFEPNKIKKFLSKEQFHLYKLIYARFVASQMKDAIFEQTTLEIGAGDYLFRATDTTPVFRGFLQAFGDVPEGDDEKANGADTRVKIPRKLAVGETLELLKLTSEQHFTEPPPRYNESSLIKTLDELGIGRPSTYAAIISTLFDRNYIERQERRLHPTELGETVNHILVNNFPDIFNVNFTARMENQLDEVESGEQQWNRVVEDFYQPFSHSLEAAKERKEEIKQEITEKTGEKCEKCGGDMIYKWGRNGKFIACSNFPQCRNTKPLKEEARTEEVTTEKCPKCGSPLVIKSGRYGKFLGCSNYPQCKHIEPLKTGIKCPREGCEGEIVERRSRRGKVFFGCTAYPKCDFMSWYMPVNQECPQCGNPFMEMHKRKTGEVIYCPKCKQTAK